LADEPRLVSTHPQAPHRPSAMSAEGASIGPIVLRELASGLSG